MNSRLQFIQYGGKYKRKSRAAARRGGRAAERKSFAKRGNRTRMRGMANEPFKITSEAQAEKDLRVLTPAGAITYASSATLVDAVMAVNERKLIIDLTNVPSVDSMAVGALVRTYVHCQKAGIKLAFVGLGQRVENVLRLTGVDPLFDAYKTVADA